MGTQHTRRAFLNSCLKTPIDPCNNCPAPIYNRPKICLGRLTTAAPPLSRSSKITEQIERGTTNVLCSSSGIRSLAEFYNSIPEYSDINHLTKQEFYSTLNSLRSTCHELKTKPCLLEEESCNTSTQSSSLAASKTKKNLKKKNVSTKKAGSKQKSKNDSKNNMAKVDSQCFANSACSASRVVPRIEVSLSRLKDCEEEVNAFKKTIKDFEDELKSRAISRYMKRAKSSSFLAKSNSPRTHLDEYTQTEPDSLLTKPTTPKCLSASLRKCYSSNDIDALSQKDENNLGPQNAVLQNPIDIITKAQKLAHKDKIRLSNYFAEKTTKTLIPNTVDLPKITVQSPTSEANTSNATTERSPNFLKKEKRIKKKKSNKTKSYSGIFALDSSSTKKENIEMPSPKHPVARPNLAATLRAEVSRKKLTELQNNCLFHDETTPQFDWEVRKTPAWRLLSLNESHKEILALRLATRKAEQALQQREYEHTMELMRQRVKSAPLLLEGVTFWGPSVGKLSHNCQNEGLQHTCDSLKRKQRMKSTEEQERCPLHYSRNKLNEIHKIYGGTTGKSSSQSRHSHRSASSANRRRKSKKNAPISRYEQPIQQNNDSGDDLCSADRAFL